MNNGISQVLGGHSFLDDEVVPVEEYGSITFHRGDADSFAVNSGTNANQFRDVSVPGARMNLLPQRPQLVRCQNGQTGKSVELITLSDDESERRHLPQFQNYRNPVQMHSRPETDESPVSLADVMRKAKECFSNNNNSYSSPYTSLSQTSLEGCPPTLLAQNLGKYWKMRYQLFSKFDQGIKLDSGKCFPYSNLLFEMMIDSSLCLILLFYQRRILVLRYT